MEEHDVIHKDPKLLLVLKDPDYDQMHILLKRESEYLTSADTFKEQSIQNFPTMFSILEWRTKIFEWYYKIVDHFEYDREVVALAIDFLDRYQILSKEHMNGEKYQLSAMTSLYIVIKMNCQKSSREAGNQNSKARLTFSLQQYVSLSRDLFTSEDVEQMELEILDSLNWKVNPVIPTDYLVKLLSVFKCKKVMKSVEKPDKIQTLLTVVYELSRYLIEIALTSTEMCFYFNTSYEGYSPSPSMLCFSTVLQCLDWISSDNLSTHDKNNFFDVASFLLQVQDPCSIERTKRIVRRSIVPNIILEGRLLPSSVKEEVAGLYPFVLLKKARVLCMDSQDEFITSLIETHYGGASSRKRKYPYSPTSVVDDRHMF